MTTENVALLPESPPTWHGFTVPLESLPDDDSPQLRGVRVDPGFVESVRRLGVLNAVTLEDNGNGYVILAGKRRVLAARRAGLTEVPAFVRTDTQELAGSVITLAENEQRSDNVYAGLLAVEGLLSQGNSVEDIAKALAIPKRRVEYLLSFAGLIDDLREALAEGMLRRTVAEAAAKLGMRDQRKLARILQTSGRLTGKDVAAVRHVQETRATEALDFGLEEARDDPTVQRRAKLEQLADLLAWVQAEPSTTAAAAEAARTLLAYLRDGR